MGVIDKDSNCRLFYLCCGTMASGLDGEYVIETLQVDAQNVSAMLVCMWGANNVQ